MSLANIEKPKDRSVICTICGDAGMGKSTLAATFPKPIFIRAEDGLQAIPIDRRPDAFPVISTVDNLWDQLQALIKEKHDYKTVVIDSVTALERLFMQHIIESDPKKPNALNQALGGYGNGAQAVASLHHRVRKACGILNANGMHVVFVAHAETETLELPDQDPYSRYTLRLGKKSLAPYVDDCDVVGFLKLQTFVKGEEGKKKAISTGQRVLVTYATPANVSKNRYGITEDLQVSKEENPLTSFISTLG